MIIVNTLFQGKKHRHAKNIKNTDMQSVQELFLGELKEETAFSGLLKGMIKLIQQVCLVTISSTKSEF